MWGFGGDLLPYGQLFESQVGGGFARFCGSCPQECGALVGDSFESCTRKSKMAAILPAKISGQSKMAAIVLAKISGYITARAIPRLS